MVANKNIPVSDDNCLLDLTAYIVTCIVEAYTQLLWVIDLHA